MILINKAVVAKLKFGNGEKHAVLVVLPADGVVRPFEQDIHVVLSLFSVYVFIGHSRQASCCSLLLCPGGHDSQNEAWVLDDTLPGAHLMH